MKTLLLSLILAASINVFSQEQETDCTKDNLTLPELTYCAAEAFGYAKGKLALKIGHKAAQVAGAKAEKECLKDPEVVSNGGSSELVYICAKEKMIAQIKPFCESALKAAASSLMKLNQEKFSSVRIDFRERVQDGAHGDYSVWAAWGYIKDDATTITYQFNMSTYECQIQKFELIFGG